MRYIRMFSCAAERENEGGAGRGRGKEAYSSGGGCPSHGVVVVCAAIAYGGGKMRIEGEAEKDSVAADDAHRRCPRPRPSTTHSLKGIEGGDNADGRGEGGGVRAGGDVGVGDADTVG